MQKYPSEKDCILKRDNTVIPFLMILIKLLWFHGVFNTSH